jgi:hypothetical protein
MYTFTAVLLYYLCSLYFISTYDDFSCYCYIAIQCIFDNRLLDKKSSTKLPSRLKRVIFSVFTVWRVRAGE